MKEGLHFLARTIVQRTQPGQRQSVKSEGYMSHVHVRDYGLAGVVVCDEEYPVTAAFSIITKVLDQFVAESGDGWKDVLSDVEIANVILEPALSKYQVRLHLHALLQRRPCVLMWHGAADADMSRSLFPSISRPSPLSPL